MGNEVEQALVVVVVVVDSRCSEQWAMKRGRRW